MAVKEVNYEKPFISETERKPAHGYGSGEAECQKLSGSDLRERVEIIQEFSFEGIGITKGKTYKGFDGSQIYLFRFSENPFMGFQGRGEKEEAKNMPYRTFVSIRKSGASGDLENPSDLELSLVDGGFKRTSED